MNVLPTVFFICWTTVNYVHNGGGDDDDGGDDDHNIASILIKNT